ncbi:MAG: MlaD family protein [Candidatus Cloacimonadales bacterium]|nr:MlaD family protein [Candidatus Cloacimonadales bacterium]
MKFHEHKKQVEFQVGLFTIIAVIILVLAYAWFTEVLVNQRYTSLKVRFYNAGNIENGSDVCLNGVKKGRVKSIQVQQDGVLVELRIVLDFPLLEGTAFKIIESNLMGDARVEITPGSGPEELNLAAIYSGERKLGLAGLIAEMGGIVHDLELILDKVSGQENFIENLQTIVDTTKVVMNKVSSSFDRNARNIEKLIANSTELTRKISRIVDENEAGISHTFEKSDQVFDELSSTLKDMKKVIDNFQLISDKMLEDNSSFSRLISEQELYDNLLKATADMDSLLLDIKKNPKKYFEIKVF